MKKLMSIVFVCIMALTFTACVDQEEPLDFAEDHWSECTNHEVVAHRLAQTSQSEVQMDCDGETVTHTVKCIYGWGIISPTVCHENN